MGLFDTLSSYFPTAYADNQAHPTEESDKAYGAPHEDSEDVGGRDDAAPGLRAGGRDEDKSAKTTLKETDSSDLPDQGNKTGEASGDDEEEEEEESGGDDEEEEEEEEEDEPVDVMPKIQEGEFDGVFWRLICAFGAVLMSLRRVFME